MVGFLREKRPIRCFRLTFMVTPKLKDDNGTDDTSSFLLLDQTTAKTHFSPRLPGQDERVIPYLAY